jgi:rhomboid protease GluP
MLRIKYNSPVILSFSFICAIVFGLNLLTANSLLSWFTAPVVFNFGIKGILSMFSYIFGHANMDHLLGNLMFILLLGPIIEEKYGSSKLLVMIVLTAFATSLLNILFFNSGIIGASGIVFMLIVLISFTNVESGKIPLTFILILLLYLGREVINSFQMDNISQFGHIIGGVCGSLFGFAKSMK